MTQSALPGHMWRRPAALMVAVLMLLPVFAVPASAQLFHRAPASANPGKPGMSTGKKVALLAGAALLYYLYRRHVAAQEAEKAQQPAANAPVRPAANSTAHAQLYRSKNGGIYYRDPQGKPVWLTVPNKPVAVSVDDLQRYAPDYNKYKGPAPTAPSGYRTQAFSDLDPGAVGPPSR